MKLIILFILTYLFPSTQQQQPTGWVENVCFCVTAGSCSSNSNTATTKGSSATTKATSATRVTESTAARSTASTPKNNRPELEQNDGSLDLRIAVSGPQTVSETTNAVNQNVTSVWVGVPFGVSNQTSCATGLELCCPKSGYGCGVRYPPVSSAPETSEEGQSPYGAYPWSVGIRSLNDDFIGSGALIHQRHVVTVAHRIYNHASVKCRFGEWNRDGTNQPFNASEFVIPEEFIVIHPNFTSLRTLRNNIAVLRLRAPGVTLGVVPTISPICLSSQLIVDQRCWVAGFGKKAFEPDDSLQTTMREVNLPLVNHTTCQTQLRATRLKQNFTLDQNSFVCAGGEAGNDACVGDGGAALACLVNNRFYLVGLVAWGIGCGTENVPGVYVNVFNYISWIQTTIKNLAEKEKTASISSTTVRATANLNTSRATAKGSNIATTKKHK